MVDAATGGVWEDFTGRAMPSSLLVFHDHGITITQSLKKELAIKGDRGKLTLNQRNGLVAGPDAATRINYEVPGLAEASVPAALRCSSSKSALVVPGRQACTPISL